MSKGHKDLPTGSQQWASEVDKLMDEVKQLKEVVRRLSENAGIDMSNPKRGINTGDTPSVVNPVGQKVSSLADVDSYNVLDGQVLSWSQQGQKWLPITPAAGGWRVATMDELMEGEMTIDADFYSARVMGFTNPLDAGESTSGTTDSYGLVGASDASAFLHAAARWYGGPTRSHSYFAAHPYYGMMGSVWINDATGNWESKTEIQVGRGNIEIMTPKGKQYSWQSDDEQDGYIGLDTNWLFLPRFTTSTRPVRADASMMESCMIYDTTIGKPIWRNSSGQWCDAMGNVV